MPDSRDGLLHDPGAMRAFEDSDDRRGAALLEKIAIELGLPISAITSLEEETVSTTTIVGQDKILIEMVMLLKSFNLEQQSTALALIRNLAQLW